MTAELNVIDRDGVRWLELCRPESKNGLTVELNQQIIAALAEVENQPALRAVVIAGSNGNFCSGLDLKDAMRRGIKPESIEQDMRNYFHGVIRAIRTTLVPVVAAVDGAAVGFGCDLALACDVRVVSDRASFAELFVRRGLMPDGGSTFALPRIVGLGRAMELMLLGERVDATHAERIGLANRVFAAAEFNDAAWAYAARLAKGPPLVHRAIKQSVYASLSGDLDAALEREVSGQVQLLGSADFTEGVMAFMQKRDPNFSGK